jgi:hypothetical protein
MPQEACIVCDRTAAVAPLLRFTYQDKPVWICAQHLPILIHKPAQLADKLPGLSDLAPPDHGH